MLAIKRYLTSEAGPSKPDPSGTAIRLIRNLLEKHGRLSTPQLWDIGTEGFKPVLPPVQEANEHGEIKMKRVSNMREGRRVWVPPPVQPMPHHPFQSVNFLKRTLLAHLESRGAIHKARGHRPAVTEQERKECETKASRMTRRRERTAAKTGGLQPPPVEPDYRVAEYAWQIGPRPYDPLAQPQSQDQRENERIAKAAEPTESVDEAFSGAEQFELAYHENRLVEEEAIRARKEIRYAKYDQLRNQVKAEKEEDIRLGRVGDIQREIERLKAIDRIYDYAQETGEDVSEWFAELGVDTRDGYGESEGRRLSAMISTLPGHLRDSKSAKARMGGSFEAKQYRRARQVVLSRPRSDDEFEFEDEDMSEQETREGGGQEQKRLSGRSFRAMYNEGTLPSPKLFGGPQKGSWKQRFGFLKDGGQDRPPSASNTVSGSRKGFGLR